VTFTAADAAIRYQALVHFVHTGTPTAMKFPFIGPLFAAPLWYLGHLVATPTWLVLRFNLILFALALAAMWWLLRDRIDRTLLRLFLLILVSASMFPWHTQDFLAETFTTVLVGVGVVGGVVGGRTLGWLVVALGAANTPASLPGSVLVAVKRAIDTRRLRYLGVPVAAAVLVAADAWFRQGQLLTVSYLTTDQGVRTVLPFSGRPGFSYPLLFGMLSILLSFGKGLFFFAPGLLIPARRLLTQAAPALWSVQVLWLSFLAGLVLVYSRWWAWYGGFAWGPRFFLFASLPASLALAARLRHPPKHAAGQLAVLGALLLSVWVGVDGVVFGNSNLDVCVVNGFTLEHLCWYVPEFSVLWRPFVVPLQTFSPQQAAFILYGAVAFMRLALPLFPSLMVELNRLLGTGRTLLDGWTV
jgi:hypothetical protein